MRTAWPAAVKLGVEVGDVLRHPAGEGVVVRGDQSDLHPSPSVRGRTARRLPARATLRAVRRGAPRGCQPDVMEHHPLLRVTADAPLECRGQAGRGLARRRRPGRRCAAPRGAAPWWRAPSRRSGSSKAKATKRGAPVRTASRAGPAGRRAGRPKKGTSTPWPVESQSAKRTTASPRCKARRRGAQAEVGGDQGEAGARAQAGDQIEAGPGARCAPPAGSGGTPRPPRKWDIISKRPKWAVTSSSALAVGDGLAEGRPALPVGDGAGGGLGGA